MAKIDWDLISSKLPTAKTAEDKEKRKQIFNQFDPNGNGILSLAEVDKGCRDVLQLHEIFDAKPVIIRAFQASKDVSKSKRGEVGDDYVERREFRLLLIYIRQYFELWQMFDTIDESDDRRISLIEFKEAVPKITEWGQTIDDPEATFQEIDKNNGGSILFEEFAHWALVKQLDLIEDDNFEDDALA